MRTLRLHATATAMLMVGLLYPAPSPAAPGPAGCGTGSWIAGTVDICAGELVYRDYVYDDYGAQGPSQAPSTGSLSNPTGTQSYPAPNGTVNNYADIAAIRLSVSGGQLLVSFELNSLFDAGSTVVALAIDTDNNAATGPGGTWSDLVAGTVVIYDWRRADATPIEVISPTTSIRVKPATSATITHVMMVVM